ncbi:response regulator [Spirosoma sp.]|uniref:response regulator n=2 Tax=unclassified Spirosoma TaxID=2621999 RepID=UPI000A52B22D|nr:response regulator [Spirosoma sp.]
MNNKKTDNQLIIHSVTLVNTSFLAVMKPIQGQLHLTTNFNNAKLLVIESNNSHWELIQQALKSSLHEVTCQHAATAEEALRLINQWTEQELGLPKLIILDLYLPHQSDGLSLLQKIKSKEPAISSIPVVIFSASGARSDIQSAYQSGASAYMIKPQDAQQWTRVFTHLRQYWWETVHLPNVNYRL